MGHTEWQAYYDSMPVEQWGSAPSFENCYTDLDCRTQLQTDLGDKDGVKTADGACCAKLIVLHADAESDAGKNYLQGFMAMSPGANFGFDNTVAKYCISKEIKEAHELNEGLYTMPGSDYVLKQFCDAAFAAAQPYFALAFTAFVGGAVALGGL